MKLKMKLPAIAVMAAMLFTSVVPAVMAEKDSKMEEILLSVKSRIDVPEECSEFRSTTSSYGSETSYHFSWETPAEAEKYKDLSVTCTGDGVITQYNYYQSESDKYISDREAVFPDFDREEVMKRAQEFSDRLNPEYKGKIVVSDDETNSLYHTDCHFSLSRMENGIPVRGGNGYISFNDGNEYVNSYYINWNTVESFAPVENAIAEQDAKKAFAEKLGMELVYDSYIDNDKREIVFYPKYVEKESRKYINALTGEIYELKEDFSAYRYASASVMETADNAVAGEGGASGKQLLTESEINELDTISGLISKEDTEKNLRANKLLNIPSDAKLDRISLSGDRYNKGVYRYSMSFSADERSIYISTDAVSGEVLSYRNFYNESGEQTEHEKEQTDEIIKQLAPSKYEEFEYTENGNYVRMKNGVRVVCDRASVTLNADGTLFYYNMNYTDNAQFPSIDEVISADEAAQSLFGMTEYNMEYLLERSESEATTAIPVYILENSYALNPFNGGAIDYKNEAVEEPKPMEYSDIANHYAKTQIEKLAEFNIGFKDGEFKPDEKITQGDFVSLVSAVFGGRVMPVARDEAYSFITRRGILKENERDDDALVTRENAAVLLIRALGAEQYAEYEDIFVKPFNDVENYKGYIAILSAMGVVEGDDDGNFNPKNLLSRAEAAIMLYNYLSR